MHNTFTPVRVCNWKERVQGGYKLHSGWALQDSAGRLVSFTPGKPWLPRGGKAAAEMVAAAGLADYATVDAQT
ncbi:hypothetical protein [Acidovorax sp. LjRoot117]|uniref:hypothetical protein n=1 Tax=Acidovorax sp. LjRoot117 TaxID=3342255 RepID=UPI003ECFDFE6